VVVEIIVALPRSSGIQSDSHHVPRVYLVFWSIGLRSKLLILDVIEAVLAPTVVAIPVPWSVAGDAPFRTVSIDARLRVTLGVIYHERIILIYDVLVNLFLRDVKLPRFSLLAIL
jgi:hypothetical protein